MKAFVTGSTGLLGNNLVRILLEQGYQVKALVRSLDKSKTVFMGLDVELIVGDMENVEAFAPALADCDVLFHAAAYFREYYGLGEHWQKLKAINVDGTIQLFNAAEAQGIKKIIYVSSGGVIGLNADGSPADESTPPDEGVRENLYFRSKVLAEEEIAQWQKNHNLPVSLILPTAIFGPGDVGPTSAGQLILNFIHGELPAIPSGGFEAVDVRDVVQAMINAVEQGKSGERYIVNNRYISIAQIVDILSEQFGVKKPRFSLSYPITLFYAQVSEFIARLTGTEPRASVSGVQTINLRRPIMTDKAQRELGITLRPFEETLRDEVQWFLKHGYIQQETSLKLEKARQV